MFPASRIVDSLEPKALDTVVLIVKIIRFKSAKANANWLKKFDSCVVKTWLILWNFSFEKIARIIQDWVVWMNFLIGNFATV